MVDKFGDVSHFEECRTGGRWLVFLITLSLFVIFVGSLILRLLVNGNISGAFVFLTYAALVYIFWLHTVRSFLVERRSVLFGASGQRGLLYLVLMSVVFGIVLESLTLIGASLSSPFVLADWGVKRIAVFTLLSFVGLSMFSGRKKRRRALDAKELSIAKTLIDKKAILITICIALAVVLALSFSASLFNLSFISVSLFGITAILPLMVIAASNKISKIPEYIFISVAIPVGLSLCILVPPMTGASWDDQIHYRNALNLSYVTSPEVTNEEQRMSEMAIRLALGERELIVSSGQPMIERFLKQRSMRRSWRISKKAGFLSGITPINCCHLLLLAMFHQPLVCGREGCCICRFRRQSYWDA